MNLLTVVLGGIHFQKFKNFNSIVNVLFYIFACERYFLHDFVMSQHVKSILGNLEPNFQTNHHIRFRVIVEAKSNGRGSKICYSTYNLISILFLNLKDGSIWYFVADNSKATFKGTTIAQWIYLCLPSYGPGLNPDRAHRRYKLDFSEFNRNIICQWIKKNNEHPK